MSEVIDEQQMFGPTWEQAKEYNWSQPETADVFPPAYMASPAELNKWDAEMADHGVDDVHRKFMSMVHHALSSPDGSSYRSDFPNFMMKLVTEVEYAE